jgi:hypothetical protein
MGIEADAQDGRTAQVDSPGGFRRDEHNGSFWQTTRDERTAALRWTCSTDQRQAGGDGPIEQVSHRATELLPENRTLTEATI